MYNISYEIIYYFFSLSVELTLLLLLILAFVMVKCGVLFEVRTEFLNNIYTSFGFKGLNSVNQLIFVMVKCSVLFEVRTGFLNNI
jgi:hypothetical protein